MKIIITGTTGMVGEGVLMNVFPIRRLRKC